MVTEACLCQLRCLPARGGVRILDFITTWRISINQMEAAGFLPGTRHILAIFADGLPNTTVAFINLYDYIMSSLNEPNDQSLPNIHHLFDCMIHIDNNIQCTCILHPSTQCPQPSNPPTTTLNQTASTTVPSTPMTEPQSTRSTRTTSILLCSNCDHPGHTGPTCFQVAAWKADERNTWPVRFRNPSHTSLKSRRLKQNLKRVPLLLKNIH